MSVSRSQERMLESEAGSSPRAAARPFGLRGMTPTSASNREPACDRSLDVAQQPIAIAGSKGLPVFKTPKHRPRNALKVLPATPGLAMLAAIPASSRG